MKNSQNTPPVDPTPHRRISSRNLVILIFSAILLIISISALVGYFFFRSEDLPERPLVLIHSPENDQELPIGSRVQIHATARDNSGIQRMEFWVDGTLEDVQTTTLEDGITPFPMVVSWEPQEIREYTITFRAFNSLGVRAHSSIIVQGILGEDRDGDGLNDDLDACPDQPGGGEDGCPILGDADGDGVLDPDDICPDLPGDEDDLGCPDRDGDGVPDHLDLDPDEPGPASLDGAPDSDGDGVPDDEDLSPEEPGSADSGGAPDSGAGDRDGDGAPDDVDPCPDEPGLPEHGYCPTPDDDPAPEDDSPEPGGVPGAELLLHLEVEGYYFRVDREYNHVWCYLQLEDLPVERYEFEPQGEREWNIRQVLGDVNSINLVMAASQDLTIFLNCQGIDLEGALHDLGVYVAEHAASEWDGRELIGTGFGLDDESYLANYRICSPSCDETAIQAPILDPITLGPIGNGPYRVSWRWDGEQENLRGFRLTINGNLVDSVAEISPDLRRMNIGEFRPECGEILEFQIAAVSINPDTLELVQSPRSNIQVWDGRTCPRTILVSFVLLDPSGRSGRDGPIYGSFYANDQKLEAAFREGQSSFDATDDPEWFLDRITSIPLMFEQIEQEAWSCIGSGCTSNYAPEGSSIEVQLGPRETLTFGASIWTERDGRLFEGFESIPAGEIIPGEYTVNNNGIEMTVLIDVLVGPEAGGEDNLPDLVVTGVSQDEESGQLRIHVFNNAADLIDEDITISVVRLSTGEELYLNTWTRITIPAGGERILGTFDFHTEPYDLRILIDPVDPMGDGGIAETNELNNVYETPVRMRVHFNSFRVAQPCESFLDLTQTAEFYFRVWVSHRSPDGVTTPVGMRNHPWAGNLEYYWGESPSIHIGEWDLHENPSFAFEFDMPADHTLQVQADGSEDDTGVSSDDYAGRILESYGPDQNYGHQDAEYAQSSQDWHECHDGTPLGWDTNNFRMWWTITRVH